MRLKIVMICVLMLSALTATAQEENNRLTISGQLLDREFREPMVQASIQLFTANDSTFVGGTVSDNK